MAVPAQAGVANEFLNTDLGTFVANNLVGELLRGDTKNRFNAYRTAIQSGWMSRNEARALKNLNPADGLDELRIP